MALPMAWQIMMKRDSPWFMVENGYIMYHIQLLRVGLLQGGMSGKGSLLAKPSKSLFWGLLDHRSSFFYSGSRALVPSQESGRELGVT